MSDKLNIAILCGGKSPEHNISLISAQNVIKSIDTSKYNILILGITQKGEWHYYEDELLLENPTDPQHIKLIASNQPILISQNNASGKIYSLKDFKEISQVDIFFPVLHGNNGEDGAIQGFAKMAGIPCVGCGLNGSVSSIDKDMMKKVLRDASIAVSPSVTIRPFNKENYPYSVVSNMLGNTLYIKPATLGSSIGVSCVSNEKDFINAVDNALNYDDKVLVEQTIVGREIECAVLGNDDPKASTIGEIIPQNDFYTFENKYVNADGALLAIPADLPDEVIASAQNLAIKTYMALDCQGLSRVDMFLTEQNNLVINEVNTIPGFTNISMYPKLWEHSGLSQMELISELINLAIERHQKESNFKHFA